MPITSESTGHSTPACEHRVDARWLMAYAAGLADLNPRYLDTAAATVVAHPVFPVCLEWPVVQASRDLPGHRQSTPAERARGVHAAHDLHLYRTIRAEDRLTTRGTVVSTRRSRAGAVQTLRLDTTDAAGELVCRSWQVSISRGVEVLGEDRQIEAAPDWPVAPEATAPVTTTAIPVSAGAAHVYTECARIWNPIHTDRAVALAAGLPDIILHGTASLALAVSRLVDGHLNGDPTRVRRLGGRFTAIVRMPSTLQLEVVADGRTLLHFRLLTETREAAIAGGFLVYD